MSDSSILRTLQREVSFRIREAHETHAQAGERIGKARESVTRALRSTSLGALPTVCELAESYGLGVSIHPFDEGEAA